MSEHLKNVLFLLYLYLRIFYFSFHILDADCVLVAVLSHGEMGILYASDQPYKPDRLWGHFNAEKCPSLAGKPKLFFVQVSETEIVPKIVTEISPKDQLQIGHKIDLEIVLKLVTDIQDVLYYFI